MPYIYNNRSFKVQDLRKTNKEELVKKALQEYDESLEKYFLLKM
jgi:hypothetical protein